MDLYWVYVLFVQKQLWYIFNSKNCLFSRILFRTHFLGTLYFYGKIKLYIFGIKWVKGDSKFIEFIQNERDTPLKRFTIHIEYQNDKKKKKKPILKISGVFFVPNRQADRRPSASSLSPAFSQLATRQTKPNSTKRRLRRAAAMPITESDGGGRRRQFCEIRWTPSPIVRSNPQLFPKVGRLKIQFFIFFL